MQELHHRPLCMVMWPPGERASLHMHTSPPKRSPAWAAAYRDALDGESPSTAGHTGACDRESAHAVKVDCRGRKRRPPVGILRERPAFVGGMNVHLEHRAVPGIVAGVVHLKYDVALGTPGGNLAPCAGVAVLLGPERIRLACDGEYGLSR